MLDLILESLSTAWRPALQSAGVQVQPPLRAIVLSGSRPWAERVTFLVFNATPHDQPVLIARLALSKSAGDHFQQEYRALQTLAVLRRLSGSVPRPLGLFDIFAGQVLLEGYLPGVRLSTLQRRGRRCRPAQMRQDFLLVLDWLLAFQSASQQGTRPFDENYIADSVRGQVLVSEKWLGELRRRAEHVKGMPLPVVGMHGDFWMGNLLLAEQSGEGRQVSVIDWEHFQRGNRPFHDLFFFLISGALAYPWQRGRSLPPLDAFRRGFLEAGWYANLVQEIFARYLKGGQSFGLPALSWEMVRLYFDLFLLEMASPQAVYGPVRTVQQVQIWQSILKAYLDRALVCPALEAI